MEGLWHLCWETGSLEVRSREDKLLFLPWFGWLCGDLCPEICLDLGVFGLVGKVGPFHRVLSMVVELLGAIPIEDVAPLGNAQGKSQLVCHQATPQSFVVRILDLSHETTT